MLTPSGSKATLPPTNLGVLFQWVLFGGCSLSEEQLSAQVRPAALGQAASQQRGLGAARGGGQASPPRGQDVKGLGGHAVPGSELHQLGGATTEAQGEDQEGHVLL